VGAPETRGLFGYCQSSPHCGRRPAVSIDRAREERFLSAGRVMATRPPRLLVGLKSRDEVSEALARGLPSIDWTYVKSDRRSDWSAVEALLVGSVERELGDYDAASTPRLTFVQGIYTGVDGFPFERFPETVRIAGNGGAFAPFVSEHAVGLALAAARAIVPVQAQVRAHRLRPPPVHRLLWKRTAVILGYGEIGRAIAERLAGFGMRIVGVNRTGRMAPGLDAVYPADHLPEALAVGDFVFDVRPLTLETAGTVRTDELRAMPADSVYVNVGRAGTVDEESLYRHLVEHPEFRAALDVWWEEDFAGGSFGSRFPFGALPNFVGTPHCAGVGPTVETYVLARAVENLARFFRGEDPRYLVDRRDYVPGPHTSVTPTRTSRPQAGPERPEERRRSDG
jgi:phosphoglycerate dehydrogenase-like enzyme